MNYIGNLKGMILYRTNERDKTHDSVIIEGITESQELNIDETEMFIRHDKTIIPKKFIQFYGDIDLNNSTDIDIIKKFNFVDETLVHDWIPSNFNYNTGYGDAKKSYPTQDALEWFKYCHCRIGKPKKIICYKLPYSKKYK